MFDFDVRRLAARATDMAELSILDAVTPYPDTLLETDSVGEALEKMEASACPYLPLVRKDGLLVGLVELQDVVVWIRDRLTDTSG